MIETNFRPTNLTQLSPFHKIGYDKLLEIKRRSETFVNKTHFKEKTELEKIIEGIKKSLTSANLNLLKLDTWKKAAKADIELINKYLPSVISAEQNKEKQKKDYKKAQKKSLTIKEEKLKLLERLRELEEMETA